MYILEDNYYIVERGYKNDDWFRKEYDYVSQSFDEAYNIYEQVVEDIQYLDIKPDDYDISEVEYTRMYRFENGIYILIQEYIHGGDFNE